MLPRNPAAPLALLLAAASTPAFAQSIDETTRLDTIIVTAAPNPEDPPVVAETRARLSRTPGAVAVVSAEAAHCRDVLATCERLVADRPEVEVLSAHTQMHEEGDG